MSRDDVTIEELLRQAAQHVARMAPSPGARDLRTRLERCRQAVDKWRAVHPTDEQQQALRQQIDEILALARQTTPTRKMRRPMGEGGGD